MMETVTVLEWRTSIVRTGSVLETSAVMPSFSSTRASEAIEYLRVHDSHPRTCR